MDGLEKKVSFPPKTLVHLSQVGGHQQKRSCFKFHTPMKDERRKEPQNHTIEKENHLNQNPFWVQNLIFRGVLSFFFHVFFGWLNAILQVQDPNR